MRYIVNKTSNASYGVEADSAQKALEVVKAGEGDSTGFTENYSVRLERPAAMPSEQVTRGNSGVRVK